MYNSLYSLINNLVFSGEALPGTVQGDVSTLLSAVLCVGVISIPFYLVYKFISRLFG